VTSGSPLARMVVIMVSVFFDLRVSVVVGVFLYDAERLKQDAEL